MSLFTERHYFLISQRISAEDNFFCCWERLSHDSKVFGIVWDTDIFYARVFTKKIEARTERSRMISYDNRGKYKVVKMSATRLNFLREKLHKSNP
jgi:hypothetical protein